MPLLSRLLAVVLVAVAGSAAMPSGASARPSGASARPSGASARSQPAEGAAREALPVLAREAAALLTLNAFSPPRDRLEVAVAPLLSRLGGDRDRAREELNATDSEGAAMLAAVREQNPRVSPDVQSALGPLGGRDLEEARAGRTIALSSETYLRALDHLLNYAGGGPPSPVAPNPNSIAAALGGGGPGPTTPPNTTPNPTPRGTAPPAADPVEATDDTVTDGDGGGTPIVPIVIFLLVAAGVVTAVLLTRSRSAAPSPPPSPTPAPATPVTFSRPSAASMQDLLDVSRRLTAAAATGNVDRLVVRHVLDLVRAEGAALVRVEGDDLIAAASTQPDLIVADGLAESSIARVAETGQTLVQVSASDRAIRNVPAALCAVPLVGGGRVLGVLVVVRRSSEPFSGDERNVLEALAPVAAAAIHNATQSHAAMESSLIDTLTGVGNRRRFDADLARVLAAGEGPTSLVMVDLDHFKAVNDDHGHQAGDAVLTTIGAILRDTVRPGDSAYRFGGEEFCVLLPETDQASAVDIAERVRARVEATPFEIGERQPLRKTASFGVATAAVGANAARLVSDADAALYAAKEGGRNQVRTAPQD